MVQPLPLDTTYTESGNLPGNSAHGAQPVSSDFLHVVTEPALTGHPGHWLLLPCRQNTLGCLSVEPGANPQEIPFFNLS